MTAVRFYKALWGMGGSLPDKLDQIASAGYSGIEAPVGMYDAQTLAPALDDHGLGFVGMLFVEDAEALKRGLEEALASGAEMANVHAGKDWWDFDRGCRFWEEALAVVGDSPLRVAFETHRGRILHSPAATAAYLRRFTELELTADFSHWTCVCESMLADQEEAVSLAVSRTALIHARVGHEQGPQVPDPRAPDWSRYVEQFELWWDRILDAATQRGESVVRVDPEFGPPNYMPTEPYSGRPTADLWDVCLWMRDRLAMRWAGDSDA
jgi:sugar phosphate isomerase/epimerase